LLKIGITGSIGSGKTTACKIFETLGVPVYYADDRGKYLLEHNAGVKAALIEAFGPDLFNESGQLKRSELAEIVFNNPAKLKILENIVHPAVQQDFLVWAAEQNAPYLLKEAALLLEAGTVKDLDKLITVTAPEQIRISRIKVRDRLSSEQILARMERQWPDAQKIAAADYVLYNDDRQLLLPQVLKLHKIFSGK
jgi:dephospho-CoA kinase